MSIRERIMAIQPIFADDVPEFHYGCFYRGCEMSADLAEARERELLAQRDELLAALKDLLSDTQHKEHECIDALCPVKVARAAIAKVEGGGA